MLSRHCGRQLGGPAGAAQRAGDAGPRGPQRHGQGQTAAQALGAIDVLLQRPLLHGPAGGRPGHLPGQAGLLQVIPHGQAGEGGLSLEPRPPQGRAQHVEAGRVCVVPAVCRGECPGSAGDLGAWGQCQAQARWLPSADPPPFVASWPPTAGLGAGLQAGISPGSPQAVLPLLPWLCVPRNWPLRMASPGLPGSAACVWVWLVEGTAGEEGVRPAGLVVGAVVSLGPSAFLLSGVRRRIRTCCWPFLRAPEWSPCHTHPYS